MSKRALVIVDVQNDFVSGSLAVPGGEKVALDISNFLDSEAKERSTMASANYDLVVTTQDWHIDPGEHWSENPDYVDSWPVHCSVATWGAELHPFIGELNEDYVDANFLKGEYHAAYSGFEASDDWTGSPLDDYLREAGIDEIHVCGLATDHCVKATALDGIRLGYKVSVLTTLSAGITPESTAAAVEDMRAAGVKIVK